MRRKNLAAFGNLLSDCSQAKVARVAHCSTADVAGRTPAKCVTEASPCRHVTAYAAAKLKMKAAVLAAGPGGHGVAVLRPTAVFEPGGQNLKQLVQDPVGGSRWRNAVKACISGRRRVHLVHVDNVVAAIIFLADTDHALGKGIFIVSDDDAPSNEFSSVEFALRRGLGIHGSPWPKLFCPSWVLSLMLRALGKDNVDPLRIYEPGKLRSLGFQPPVPFEEGLSRYVAWHRTDCLDCPVKVGP